MVRFGQLTLAIIGLTAAPLMMCPRVQAQDASVKPGINESFESPQVEEWVERFEREGREVYDQRDRIVKLTGVRAGMRVADVGAGTGLFTRLFADKVGAEGKVYAVDISDEFIDQIRALAEANQVQQIEGVVCKADDAMLPPNSLDLVYICDTYHHFEFPFKTMASIYKALRPDGRVVLVDFRRVPGESSDWILNHVRAGQATVREEVEQVGFRFLSEAEGILDENYIMVFGK